MQGYIAPADYDWYRFLRAVEPPVDEVNFWRPGEKWLHRIVPGEPFFFKLKAPHNAIAGFGFFAHYSLLPVSLAWEVYGQANGAATFVEMRERLVRLRSSFRGGEDPRRDFPIGCILIHEPVFFERNDWVDAPRDWKPNIVQGKGYDLREGEGRRVWETCFQQAIAMRKDLLKIADAPHPARFARHSLPPKGEGRASPLPSPGEGYGDAVLVRPRLGQKSFRIAVLDSYSRRCAVTGEWTLPALEAAHIREYSDVEEHSIPNGILFRADIHKIFDRGYVTVDPDYRFVVSKRIREEFENGRDYYALHGRAIRLPERSEDAPGVEYLRWHNEERFRG